MKNKGNKRLHTPSLCMYLCLHASLSCNSSTKIQGWDMQPFVSLVFHNLPSLYPSSLWRNYCFGCSIAIITGGKPPEKTVVDICCADKMDLAL